MSKIPKIPASVLCAVMMGILSYTIQRLIDAQNEPPMGTVLLQTTIPYYWRIAMACLHATASGLLCHALLPQLTMSIQTLKWIVSALLILCVLALIVVP